MKRRKQLIKWATGLASAGTLLQVANCGPDTANMITTYTVQIWVLLAGALVDATAYAIRSALGV